MPLQEGIYYGPIICHNASAPNTLYKAHVGRNCSRLCLTYSSPLSLCAFPPDTFSSCSIAGNSGWYARPHPCSGVYEPRTPWSATRYDDDAVERVVQWPDFLHLVFGLRVEFFGGENTKVSLHVSQSSRWIPPAHGNLFVIT